MTKKTFRDDFGNHAEIVEGRGLPYKGASEKVPEFVLTCFSDYDGGKMYYLSIYETFADALAKLKTFSAGTFKAI